jgi:hypothetical protein
MKKRAVVFALILVLAIGTTSCFEPDSDPCPDQVCCFVCDDWCTEGGSTRTCMSARDCSGPLKSVESDKSLCKGNNKTKSKSTSGSKPN